MCLVDFSLATISMKTMWSMIVVMYDFDHQVAHGGDANINLLRNSSAQDKSKEARL